MTKAGSHLFIAKIDKIAKDFKTRCLSLGNIGRGSREGDANLENVAGSLGNRVGRE